MGSKRGIVSELCRIFPKADNFYDLFGGGFSVSHYMIKHRSKDFKEFHFNEIRPGICDLIKDAIDGQYSYENFKPKWISREDFFENVDKDPYIKICWSFGNNGRTYLYSQEIEPYKKSMHNAVVFNEFDDLAKEVLKMERFKDGFTINQRRLFLRQKIEQYRINGIPKVLHQFLNEKQLQRLEQLERLQFTSLDYRQVNIKQNSIAYCDIPYIGTAEYDNEFNHKEFYDWADSQDNPVFISEYRLDDDRFKAVWMQKKRSMLSSKKDYKANIEKVFANKAAQDLIHKNLMGAKNG